MLQFLDSDPNEEGSRSQTEYSTNHAGLSVPMQALLSAAAPMLPTCRNCKACRVPVSTWRSRVGPHRQAEAKWKEVPGTAVAKWKQVPGTYLRLVVSQKPRAVMTKTTDQVPSSMRARRRGWRSSSGLARVMTVGRRAV